MAGHVVDRRARAQCNLFARGRCTRGASCPYLHEAGPALRASKPCRYFAAGHCPYGNACKFVHDNDKAVTAEAPPRKAVIAEAPPRKTQPCRYFAAGHCHYGNACKFVHDNDKAVTAEAPPRKAVVAEAPPRKTQPCRYFAAGKCSWGEKCRLAHGEGLRDKPALEDPGKRVPRHVAVGGRHNGDARPSPHELAPQVDEELDPVAEAMRFCLETDELVDDWIRVIDGAVVKFGEGASVQTVSLASDFSAVHLDNLPPGSTATSVAETLQKLGVRIREEDVKVRPGAARASADIKVEDPSFAALVREKLAASGSQLRATRIDVPMPTGSSLHRVDCHRVLCSWQSPRRTVWLNFATRQEALDVYSYLLLHSVRIKNRLVVPGVPTGPRSGCWSVRLPNMDAAVDKPDFCGALPSNMQPARISLAWSTYNDEVDAVAGRVGTMLRIIGPLESWSVIAASRCGDRIKAQARFENEGDAKRAAELLNGTAVQMPEGAHRSAYGVVELAVQRMPAAIIKVPRRNYAALKEMVDRQREIWSELSDGDVHIVTHPSGRTHVVLRLQGSNTRMVAEAHTVLSEIFQGIELEVSKGAWNTMIQNQAWWRGISQRISQDFGVTVVRDGRRSQLRVFGELVDYERTRQKIAVEVEKCVAEARIIELDNDAYRWACWGGGFKKLVARMGRDKLAMDTMSTPKRILCLDGSESVYKTVMRAVHARSSSSSNGNTRGVAPPPSHTDNTATTTDCCVCWTEAEDAMETPCGHVYCGGCFVGLCCGEGAPADGNSSQIVCVGDGDTCKKALPLLALKEHLSSAQLEKALQDAFALHVRQHPQDFRFCPTPDCGRVYRVHRAHNVGAAADAEPVVFTCPACIESTCTACHGYAHRGYTCDEFRDLSTGGYEALARAKARLGVKDCPRCKAPIEKSEGCNHMTCRCGAHICWKCLAVFDTSGPCYAHLNSIHGGYLDIA